MGRLAPHSAPGGYSLPGSGIRVAESCFQNNYFHLKGRHFFHVRFSERQWFHNKYENTVWKKVGTTFQYLVFFRMDGNFDVSACMSPACGLHATCGIFCFLGELSIHEIKRIFYIEFHCHMLVWQSIYIYTHTNIWKQVTMPMEVSWDNFQTAAWENEILFVDFKSRNM